MLFSSAWGVFWVLLLFNGAIVVHEYGHYIAARWRGLKVDRFSLFGLGRKLISWKGRDGVEYCICAIPFGAYVTLPQLAEMRGIEGGTEDDERDKLPPISYADKMYVAFAGPLFNFMLAILIALVGWYTGYPSDKGAEGREIGVVLEELDNGAPGPAYQAGLRAGDSIIAVDGEPIESFMDVPEMVALGKGRDSEGNPQTIFTIERDGQQKDVSIQPELVQINSGSKDLIRQIGIGSSGSLEVIGLQDNSPAKAAGLQLGDTVLSADGEKLYSVEQLSQILGKRRGETIPVVVDRAGQEVTLNIDALPVPTTRPVAVVTLPGGEEPAFEIIPQYPLDTKEDPSLPETASLLAVFTMESGEKMFQSDGDWTIESVNGQQVGSLAALQQAFAQAAGGAIALELTNGKGQTRKRELPAETTFAITPPNERVMLGFITARQMVLIHQNPLVQFQEHIERTFRTLGSLLSPKSDIGVRHLSGVVGITTNLYKIAQWDWRRAIWFAVLLNINLAILNLLPIPVLDGGHMTIATIQKLSGHKLPAGFIFGMQYAFMFLLLGVMCYVMYFDTMREVGYHEERQAYERTQSKEIRWEFRPDRYEN
ncbi:M50 family metallopeptidase [Cerasicoccus fimbriatus]|uniref:M50 family metallopeptidase n=1 Tax=Cerasicoccus fimbriatus TaxID=3014554 RepID=UPI0022B419F9|nr:site-2 protease family protein [Cerasicoccus sp. TK19100]